MQPAGIPGRSVHAFRRLAWLTLAPFAVGSAMVAIDASASVGARLLGIGLMAAFAALVYRQSAERLPLSRRQIPPVASLDDYRTALVRARNWLEGLQQKRAGRTMMLLGVCSAAAILPWLLRVLFSVPPQPGTALVGLPPRLLVLGASLVPARLAERYAEHVLATELDALRRAEERRVS